MDASIGSTPDRLGDSLDYAREILRTEARTLNELAGRLDGAFLRAVDWIFHCRGSVIVTGMGKAGLVGQKIAATLASTGTRSHYLHPAEAVHGDLGRIHHDDLVLLLSQSGETDEVVRLLPPLKQFGVVMVAITARRSSQLGRAADIAVLLGDLKEACVLGLAPSTSTTAMLATGDALALVVSRLRDFRAEDFARFHPGGSLGRKLRRVEEAMRPLSDCRLAHASTRVRRVIVEGTRPGRRSGAIMLTDDSGCLVGIFTDSDLARLIECHGEDRFDRPIHAVMTRDPWTIRAGTHMRDAVRVIATRKLSELPVVDAKGRPLGLIDITDVVGLLPNDATTPVDTYRAA